MTRAIQLWGRLAACGRLASGPGRPASSIAVARPILFAALLLLFLVRFAPAQSCTPLAADQVLGKDLAAALPAFQPLPPEILIAPVPPPGTRRIFHAAELLSIARRYGIQLDNPSDVCFEWRSEPLNRDQIVQAMLQTLAIPGARVEIADLLLSPVPAGQLEFPRDLLGAPAGHDPQSPVLWRGSVLYGSGHRFPIWARVRVFAPCTRITAAENLKAAQPLAASQLRQSPSECFPSENVSLTVDQIAGNSLRHAVSARTEITADLLISHKEVNHGDMVEIQVFSGAAHLAFTGKAESDGNSGDMIAVRNPASNRIFRARVTGKGKAVVMASPAADSSIENPKD
ncbi:MAG TPA: flagellar basal body P-ring formation chaperone FlgA [Verrucomicrobiae bacterium]|nr:flagellar basal body P-ring formation chaperone FlgA [Verrucomicrobiae bacterium]